MDNKERRYILTRADCPEAYLDFGAKFTETIGAVKIVEVAAENAEWQHGRLRSGLLALSKPVETRAELDEWISFHNQFPVR